MPAPATTRDKEFRRARVVVVRPGESSRVSKAFGDGATLMCGLLLLCVLVLVNGCSTNAPSTNHTRAAATPDSSTRPVATASASEVPANGLPSPTASSGTENLAREAPNSSSEQGDAAASAAYEGFYEVLGARPKGFEQFGNFMIRAPQGGRISGAVVPLEGEIYEFARATLAERKLTFETKQVGGISYTFDGQFLARPPFANDKKAAVAEGLVKKFRGTKLASEASMKFYFDEGGEDP